MSGSHKYTWEKDKLTFFTPILENKTKKLLLNLKGHQSSGAWAPELWCPKILLVVLLTHIRWQSSSYFLVHNNITKTTTTIQHLWHLIPCTLSQKNPVNPLSSILYPISIFLSEVFVYNFRWCHWNNGGRPLVWGNQRLSKMSRPGAGARMAGLNLTNGWWSAPMTGGGSEGGNAHWEMAIVFTLWVCRKYFTQNISSKNGSSNSLQ